MRPALDREDWVEDTENADLQKVRGDIDQMGLEDETYCQNIKSIQS